MRRSALIPLLLVAGALAFLAASCGGGSKEASDTTVATETAATDVDTTEDTTTEDGDDGVSDIASADDCQELAQLGAKLAQALSGSGGSDLEQTRRFLNEFAARAPDEIRADFELLAEAYSQIVDALGDVDLQSGETPSPEVIQRLQELGEEIDQERLQEASQNIQTWADENCR